MCEGDFWARHPYVPTATCSPACADQLMRRTQLAIAALSHGEHPNERSFQRRIFKNRASPTRVFIRAHQSRQRSKRRRHRARLKQLSAKLAARTIVYADVRYARSDLALIMKKALDMDVFSPADAAKLRKRLADIVETSLDKVDSILNDRTDANGKPVSYSQAQVALFKALLNKVVPDVSASFNTSEIRHVNVTELSLDDLKRLAAGQQLPVTLTQLPGTNTYVPGTDLQPAAQPDPIEGNDEGSA